MINQKFNQLWMQLLWKNFSCVKNATNTLTRWQKMKNKQRKEYTEKFVNISSITLCAVFFQDNSFTIFFFFIPFFQNILKYLKFTNVSVFIKICI